MLNNLKGPLLKVDDNSFSFFPANWVKIVAEPTDMKRNLKLTMRPVKGALYEKHLEWPIRPNFDGVLPRSLSR